MRPCLDPRAINKLLPDDKYPIPLIKDILESLSGATVMSTIDLKDAYHRFKIYEPDQPKTAFTWRGVQYMFVGAPFGLKPLSSKFQRVMNILFADISHFVLVFIDDIVVFSRSLDDHAVHVRTVIQRLTNANLLINIAKCHFAQSEILLLGFRVSTIGIRIDQSKLVNVQDWPVPTNNTQVQHYLGVINYFRDHIPLISRLCAPLDALRKCPDVPNAWSDECQRAFDSVKAVLLEAPILHHPDFSRPFHVATDASNVGIAAVLYQLPPGTTNDDNAATRQYITFLARALHPAEKNYSATKKELLAIIFALNRFHYYLWGNPCIRTTKPSFTYTPRVHSIP